MYGDSVWSWGEYTNSEYTEGRLSSAFPLRWLIHSLGRQCEYDVTETTREVVAVEPGFLGSVDLWGEDRVMAEWTETPSIKNLFMTYLRLGRNYFAKIKSRVLLYHWGTCPAPIFRGFCWQGFRLDGKRRHPNCCTPEVSRCEVNRETLLLIQWWQWRKRRIIQIIIKRELCNFLSGQRAERKEPAEASCCGKGSQKIWKQILF